VPDSAVQTAQPACDTARVACAKVERLSLTEAWLRLGHANDTVTVQICNGADPHELVATR